MASSPEQRYRRLQVDLLNVRLKHQGEESEEEDPILDRMDRLWDKLTLSEQEAVEEHDQELEVLLQSRLDPKDYDPTEEWNRMHPMEDQHD